MFAFLTNEVSASPVNKVASDADWKLPFRPQKTRDIVVYQINENVQKRRLESRNITTEGKSRKKKITGQIW